MAQRCDLLINNVNLATMQRNDQAYGAIENASLAVSDGRIVYAGSTQHCPYQHSSPLDGRGGWLTPGLIDCHSHLIYGGDRAGEFEQRLTGVSYEEIARAGGGIKSTVRATRDASEKELLQSATTRARRLLEEGVTTIEIKSGYGLDSDTEKRMLRVARTLGEQLPITVVRSYLGAHALPPEYSDADAYIDFVCTQMIPEIAAEQLAHAVDVFCEGIGFSPAQCERVFAAAQSHGLAIKAHAEQLSDLQGAKLASEYGALSVDHIEYLNPADIPAIADAGTVAVLLPGAFYYLHETRQPPISALRQAGVAMAVATDFNPGTSPIASLLTTMNMACVLFALTPEEALQGTTVNAAQALGLGSSKGRLAEGFDADFCLWAIKRPAELVYGINQLRPTAIWQGGQRVTV
ncbi:MAG: imidazolonepropionase [Gammaproteobacteria bacterium]|nr:MAG: imidazolonepropionase [Gammaproteobacteria bacterium]